MSLGLKAIKGMKDTLPEEMAGWYFVESQLKNLLMRYGYQEIRMPLLEQTSLFQRAIGEVTDIVQKEMYTFVDKSGDSLTLRPEGTAQAVRAALENSLIRQQSQRLWYYGPMFRRENPQKGRYRQFYQLGVEAFGLPGPDVDVEQILMMWRLWRELGLSDKIALQLNSLGTAQERAHYREGLVRYFEACEGLDEESTQRLYTNPLRILDSKNPSMQNMIENAPSLLHFLGDASMTHFEAIQRMLKEAKVPYEINPRLVRGLDYYTHTVYEWVTDALGAQGTVCAGGRYDDLVQQMGGPSTAAVGFAVGVERLLLLLTENELILSENPLDAYLVVEEGQKNKGFLLAEILRDALKDLRLCVHCGEGSFKSQFKRADKSKAVFALVLGEDEIKNNSLSIKHLRGDLLQQTLPLQEAIHYLKQHLGR